MNLPTVVFRANAHRSAILSRSLTKPCLSFSRASRKYATHRQATESSSLLSQSLDTGNRANQRRQNGDSVGPFQLGVSQSSLGQKENVKKWSELSTGGKVKRTTARTTNLTVILFGAGLSALLIYSLTTELFSKNSPTVLHNDACNRIKASQQVAKYLNEPVTFHNTTPSAGRPRHRNHHVQSQVMVDSTGREHMFLNFYVQGRPPGAAPPLTKSYFETVIDWTRDTTSDLSTLTWDEAVTWTKERTEYTWDQSKRAFKYLIGREEPGASIPEFQAAEAIEAHKHEKKGGWQLTGMFSSLRGSSAAAESRTEAQGHGFTHGEVHAELVRNNDGYFVFRYILIDFPSSRNKESRVFVERAPGVRDSEAVVRWNSS